MNKYTCVRELFARGVWTGVFVIALSACGGGGGNVQGELPAEPSAPPPPITPTDEHLSLTNTYVAHREGLSGEGVGIAFLDTGLDRQHPAFGGRVSYSKISLDPEQNDLSVDDKVGHGSQVAQIAAGQAFGLWPGGIAPKADLVSWRILKDAASDEYGRQKILPDTTLAAEAGWIGSKARIVNVSTDKLYWDDEFVADRIFDLFSHFAPVGGGPDAKLVVVATGDSGDTQPSQLALIPEMPAKPDLGIYPSTLGAAWINVGAVKTADTTQLAEYSNACGITKSYCMVAPGDVFVTGANDTPDDPTYHAVSGTGYAAAQVSGAAALVWQQFPTLSNSQVQQVLLASATDLGMPGVDEVFGWGMLDVAKAVRGPSNFAWGDFELVLNGGEFPMTWRNEISGPGGLVIHSPDGPASSLFLDAPMTYTGKTIVHGGSVSVGSSMASPVELHGGNFQISGGTFSGDLTVAEYANVFISPDPSREPVVIEGDIFNDAGLFWVLDVPPVFTGDYNQSANGIFGVVLGSQPMHIEGRANIAGYVWVLDVLDDYVVDDHTVILIADGGVSGIFTELVQDDSLLLEATISSDANSVWLDVERADVVTTAMGVGLQSATIGGAQRVESAFRLIDQDMADGQAGKSSAQFVSGAAAIQRASTIDELDRTLSSLSGELHNADTAFAMMAIEGSRHALESRLDEVGDRALAGAWTDRLGDQRSMGPHTRLDADGWMLGHDSRFGQHWTVGAAFGQTDGIAAHDLRGDRERNRQLEAQAYAAWNDGGNYLMGRVAMGRMDRWMQRNILLGGERFGVDAQYDNRYATVGLQAGHRFHIADATLTPYVGTQSLQIARDGFSEQGAAGFGLSTHDSRLDATQALVGARIERQWSIGATKVGLQGRVEWQRTLSQSGDAIDARFTGIDAWSPIAGAGLGEEVAVFGFGLHAWLPIGGRLGLDIDSRRENGRSYTGAFANWSVGF